MASDTDSGTADGTGDTADTSSTEQVDDTAEDSAVAGFWTDFIKTRES